MSFGFPASYELEVSNIPSGTDTMRSVGSALAKMGWKPKIEGSIFRATTSLNMSSMGEKVTVQVLSGGKGVKVRSQCSMFLQILDGGKNKRNVERFLAELPRHYIGFPAQRS